MSLHMIPADIHHAVSEGIHYGRLGVGLAAREALEALVSQHMTICLDEIIGDKYTNWRLR